jgi:hypothetical protein
MPSLIHTHYGHLFPVPHFLHAAAVEVKDKQIPAEPGPLRWLCLSLIGAAEKMAQRKRMSVGCAKRLGPPSNLPRCPSFSEEWKPSSL